jgi:DNA replication and repair protein RecF
MRFLRLHSFRCHPELAFALEPGHQVFIGANGRGKTSLLEAVYFLSRLRSFRSPHPRELAQWNAKAWAIDAQTDAAHLGVRWDQGRRELRLDGQAVSLRDFWGRLRAVLFTNDDRDLVTGPGLIRRNWFDGLLAQSDPAYLGLALRYARLHKQRNAWLKHGAADHALGEALTQQLTEAGWQITEKRRAASEEVRRHAEERFHAICGEPAPLVFAYRPNFQDTEPDWARVAEQERRLQQTLLGPHRDDWILSREGHGVGRFGSEGQQRMAALSLRLAEAQMIRDQQGAWPVLLIDDVTHQLDARRRSAFARLLPPDAQILETMPHRPPESSGTVWEVEPGRVRKI